MFRPALAIAVLTIVFATLGAPNVVAQTRTPAAAPVKPAAAAAVNINTASAAELDALPGIGAKTAALIVDYRQKNGPFKKVEELMNIRGIGEKNFLKLKPQLTIGAAKADHAQPQQH